MFLMSRVDTVIPPYGDRWVGKKSRPQSDLLFFVSGSAFLAEVGETEGRRGLILPLFTQGHDDQHDQSDDVGQHLVQLLDSHLCAGGQIDVQNVQTTKQDGGQNTDIGTPDGEDVKLISSSSS